MILLIFLTFIVKYKIFCQFLRKYASKVVRRMPVSYTHATTSKQVVKLAPQEAINLLRTSPASCHLEGHADFIDLVFYFFSLLSF